MLRWSTVLALASGCQLVFEYQGAPDGVPDDASADASTPDDLDGDGIANPLDNCPTASNPDQADEDADTIGDRCDPCPIDSDATRPPLDDDGDGVGDACDPDPQAPNSIVAFFGFNDPAELAELSGVFNWQILDGELRNADSDLPEKVLTAESFTGDLQLRTAFRILERTTLAISTERVALRFHTTQPQLAFPDGLACEVYDERMPATPLDHGIAAVRYENELPAPASPMNFNFNMFTVPQPYTITARLSGGTLTCAVGTAGGAFGATISGLTEQSGTLGFATIGTRIAVPYVLVIR